MEVTETSAHHLPVVGRINEGNIHEFRYALDQAVHKTSKDVVLDLTQAEQLNAMALGLLIRANRHLTRYGRTLSVVDREGGAQRKFHPREILAN